MREKRGADSFRNEHFEKAKKFINGKISEDEYLHFHKEQGSKHFFELTVLKKDMALYVQLLRKLSLPGRRKILFDAYSTGFVWSEYRKIFEKYNTKMFEGFSDNRIDIFIKNGEASTNGIVVAAMFAIICRVPLNWLTTGRASAKWSYDCYENLDIEECRASELLASLNDVNRYTISVEGINLLFGNRSLYVRKEIKYGSVMMEICEDQLSNHEVHELNIFFIKFGFSPLYMRTIFPQRYHLAYFHPLRSREIVCLPMEAFYHTPFV
ncbi:hypothetical protein QFZ81_000098 [Paenibacillus sp. V4I9]|uniref:hypothetical protein n=1 Tax=Paenibacillus sp. V4I9 TaxID=3042308 RepID=UPI00278360F2|nr:hypothetical protein [Paenibacillus sp. V4I9]MDQ0885010.1 hypothetical protein [Paenibacillus sp. V4I9]